MRRYLCNECLQPCETRVVDDGVGYYEFAGQEGYDERLRVVSDCCDAAFEEPQVRKVVSRLTRSGK